MKKNRWIGITVGILFAAVVLLMTLNRGNLEEKRALESNAQFAIIQEARSVKVDMRDIEELQPESFTTIMDTSTTAPTEVAMKGVELRKILEAKDISLEPGQTVEVRALDGYASALTYEEVMTPEDVYIVIEMNGEMLTPKKEGGMGPYLMVIRSAQFAQRWVKFVQDVEIK